MLCMRCLSCRPSRLFLRSSFILFSAIMNTHSRHALYSHQIYITLLIFSNLKTVARSSSQAQPCDTMLQVKSKKSIPANQIKSVEKVLFLGCDGYEFNAPKNRVRPQIYIYGGIIVALFLIVFGEIMLVLGIVAYLFCSLVTMNLLSNVFVNKNFSFEACDELLIKDRANGFINFVFSKSDRLELKKYFLLKTGQNLDNLQRKPILF